jgi:hypothetical protein
MVKEDLSLIFQQVIQVVLDNFDLDNACDSDEYEKDGEE